MTTEIITINKGFKTIQKTDRLDLYSAYDIVLGTSKQFRYSEVMADIKDNAAYFKKDLLVCPACGFQFGAYKHTIGGYNPQKVINRSKAYEWCNILSFFDEPHKVLNLYKPSNPTNDIICPNCSHSAPVSSKTECYTFQYSRHKLTISTELTYIKDVLKLRWADGLTITDFPLTETITFNFKKGRIFLTLKTNNRTICIKDISKFYSNTSSKLISVIDNNAFIKGTLKRYFLKEWKKTLPYKKTELNFKRFCEMTMYIGYTKEFYSYIPYEYGSNKETVYSTLMGRIRKNLQRYEFTPNIFNTSSLPKTKAIKKIMFDNPYFFLYIEEIEKLDRILSDVNYLITFLKDNKALVLLSFMHKYDNIFVFYEDFAKIKSKKSLLKYILCNCIDFNRYSMVYLSYGEKHRKIAQKEWKDDFYDHINAALQNFFDDVSFDEFSLPDNMPVFSKMSMDGYTFCLLQTRNDYVYYGKELCNCLGEMQIYNPVICMNKNGHAVAAIEVNTRDMFVEQALLKDNVPIEENKSVYAAFKKWCKANCLQYEES